MFRIKICGVKTVEDAQKLIDAGADAIGLNFYAPSPRSISIEVAKKIVDAIDGRLKTIGVFVNAGLEEITQTAKQLGLSGVQLHGDEPAELIASLPNELPVIRAFRVGEEGLVPVAKYLADCESAGRLPEMALVDAASSVAYGGTGEQVDWEKLKMDRQLLGDMPLILAGGLKPSNVHAAIRIVRPSAVDTASGVESSPGEKKTELVDAFVMNSIKAYEDQSA